MTGSAASLGCMRLPLALTAAALAVAFAAAPAQASPSAPAQGFTPPIGTDKGSVDRNADHPARHHRGPHRLRFTVTGAAGR